MEPSEPFVKLRSQQKINYQLHVRIFTCKYLSCLPSLPGCLGVQGKEGEGGREARETIKEETVKNTSSPGRRGSQADEESKKLRRGFITGAWMA